MSHPLQIVRRQIKSPQRRLNPVSCLQPLISYSVGIAYANGVFTTSKFTSTIADVLLCLHGPCKNKVWKEVERHVRASVLASKKALSKTLSCSAPKPAWASSVVCSRRSFADIMVLEYVFASPRSWVLGFFPTSGFPPASSSPPPPFPPSYVSCSELTGGLGAGNNHRIWYGRSPGGGGW